MRKLLTIALVAFAAWWLWRNYATPSTANASTPAAGGAGTSLPGTQGSNPFQRVGKLSPIFNDGSDASFKPQVTNVGLRAALLGYASHIITPLEGAVTLNQYDSFNKGGYGMAPAGPGGYIPAPGLGADGSFSFASLLDPQRR